MPDMEMSFKEEAKLIKLLVLFKSMPKPLNGWELKSSQPNDSS
jgi:hypothetical protein